MTRIAIIAESPNDSHPFADLLNQHFNDCEFYPLLSNIRGGNLDAGGFPRLVRAQFLASNPKPDLLIAIRDLDALGDDTHQVQLRKDFFTKIRSVINTQTRSDRRASGSSRKDVPFASLLCIYEFEALLLADISVVNAYYGIEMAPVAEPETVEQPKEFLQTHTTGQPKGPYQESHCGDLFPDLNIDLLSEKLPHFSYFLSQLESLLPSD